jgi:type III restriction-modification system: methylase
MKKELENLLLQHEEFFVEGMLNKNKLSELSRKYDAKLLNVLMREEKIKNHFFSELEEGILVFKKDVFLQFLNNKEFLPDSFTAYKTKIGLGNNDGSLLSENHDIVLNFPYKDCILEGGQTKEDAKRDEIFFNETLAPTEITRLLDAKVFTNFKRYNKDGEHEVQEIKDNDNLIIKGNNLVVLHSLKKKYIGKVQVIYIDPPYNTGNDSFGYNDRFNHSTWLTFMKNRLEIAKELLSETGSIFVQIDSFEQAYVKVLMDEIFGKENFRNAITWKRKGGSANPSNQLNNVTEWILWYVKNVENMKYEPIYSLNDENTKKYIKERFKYIDEKGRVYMKSPIQSPNFRENLIYDYKGYKTPKKGYSVSKEVMERLDEEGRLDFPDSKDKNINRKIYLDEYKGQPINSLWTDIFVINPMSNERTDFGSGQKPETLIYRLLNMVSSENDLVLDYHLGSGTTAAVAHKMNRKYIGIEQMDYIENITVERMKKVIAGEQGGISKDVNWHGGGEFVYCELKNDVQDFKTNIIESESTEKLIELFTFVKKSSFLSYRVDSKKLKEKEFLKLSFAEQKQLLLEIVDNNNLYVNYSDIDDENYDISKLEKKLNREFFKQD